MSGGRRWLTAALVACAGCVPAAVIEQVRTEVAVHQGVLRQWEGLSAEERRVAYEASLRGWEAQHHNLTGEVAPGAEAP